MPRERNSGSNIESVQTALKGVKENQHLFLATLSVVVVEAGKLECDSLEAKHSV